MTPMLYAGILQLAILGGDAAESTASVPDAATQNAPNAQQAVAKDDTYDEAHRVTVETGKPMVVMVGTDWCGPCQMMKRTILPRVRERGLFRKVAFALVNADRDRELAQELTGGGPVPQLVMFRKTEKGWLRRTLVGGQSVEAVEQFINEGIALDEAAKKAGPDGKADQSPPAEKSPQTTSHQQDGDEASHS